MCPTCHLDVPVAIRQVEIAQQKLELWQEKLTVESELLKSEKRTWRRKCQAVRASTLEKQRAMETLESESADKLQESARQLQTAQKQLQEERERIVRVEEEHNARVHRLEQEIQQAREESRILAAQLHKTSAAKSEFENNNDEGGCGEEEGVATNQIEQQLRSELEDKVVAMESLEMQLLELERERDELLKAGGGAVADRVCGGDDDHHGGGGEEELRDLRRQLDEAQSEARQHKLELVQALRRQRHDTESAEQQEASELLLQRQQREAIEQLKAELDAVRIEADKEREHVGALTRQLASVMQENQSLLHQQQQTSSSSTSTSSSLIAKVSSALLTSAAGPESSTTTTATADSFAELTPEQHAALGRSYVKELEWNGTGKNYRKDTDATAPADDDEDDEGNKNATGDTPTCWMGRYTGYVNRRGHPDGPGTLRVEDGAILDSSDWKDGQPNGYSVLATVGGDVFRGIYTAGDKSGFGVYVWCDGRVYRGEYHEDRKHGSGVLTWPYGAWFEGQFENDKRNGTGEYHYADGRVYKGEYRDDRAHGRGVLTAQDGTVIYDGQWELGAFVEGGGIGGGSSPGRTATGGGGPRVEKC